MVCWALLVGVVENVLFEVQRNEILDWSIQIFHLLFLDFAEIDIDTAVGRRNYLA